MTYGATRHSVTREVVTELKLYVAISAHGYGHLAQTAAVLAALAELVPGLELVVRSALPRAVLAARLDLPFRHLAEPCDCNMAMRDAVRVDAPASLAAYRAFHRDWARRVDGEAGRLAALGVDAVFSNVGYLPLAAAREVGLPAVALCSLNWADIFRHYLGGEAGAGEILAQMGAAYAGATVFLRPTPAMPMADLGNARAIPPVARAGRARRAELRRRLGLAPDARLVLIGMGGVVYRPPVEDWPRQPDIVWLAPDDWRAGHPGFRPLSAAGMPFRDVLASSDALVTKPGYGSYVEAATAGVPVLALPRPDWPETPCLNDWLGGHGRWLEIPEEDLRRGALRDALEGLWAMPAGPAARADGAPAAARVLRDQALSAS